MVWEGNIDIALSKARSLVSDDEWPFPCGAIPTQELEKLDVTFRDWFGSRGLPDLPFALLTNGEGMVQSYWPTEALDVSIVLNSMPSKEEKLQLADLKVILTHFGYRKTDIPSLTDYPNAFAIWVWSMLRRILRAGQNEALRNDWRCKHPASSGHQIVPKQTNTWTRRWRRTHDAC